MSPVTTHTVSQTVRSAFLGQSFVSPRVQFRTPALWDIPDAFALRKSAACFVHIRHCALRRSVSSLFTRVTDGSLGLHIFVHCFLPQRTTLPASLPLTLTVPFRFQGLAADGNMNCSVLVSALHPHSLGVVTDSFTPLVVESGDEPT